MAVVPVADTVAASVQGFQAWAQAALVAAGMQVAVGKRGRAAGTVAAAAIAAACHTVPCSRRQPQSGNASHRRGLPTSGW